MVPITIEFVDGSTPLKVENVQNVAFTTPAKTVLRILGVPPRVFDNDAIAKIVIYPARQVSIR